MSTEEMLLEVKNLSKQFGGIKEFTNRIMEKFISEEKQFTIFRRLKLCIGG